MINTGAIAKALRPGVQEWFGLSYNELPLQFLEIFEKYSSMMNFEEDVSMYGLGLASVKPENTTLQYDTMAQAFLKRYVHITYALGYVISREAIEDNKYPQLAKEQSQRLGWSMRQTLENLGANVLNRAFNSSYTGADGLELCSTAHLKAKGGTFSNKIATAADLSEASLEQALIDISGFEDDAGLKISAQGMKLIVPRQLQFDAVRILNSVLKNDTAENAINAMRFKGALPDGFVVNHYLSDSDAWFVKTNVMKGMKYIERRGVEIESDTPEFDTDNVKFKASMRCSFGWTDPRGMYGSPGA